MSDEALQVQDDGIVDVSRNTLMFGITSEEFQAILRGNARILDEMPSKAKQDDPESSL